MRKKCHFLDGGLSDKVTSLKEDAVHDEEKWIYFGKKIIKLALRISSVRLSQVF